MSSIATVIRDSLSPLAPIPTGMDARLEVPWTVRAVLFDIYGTLLISGTGDIGIAATQRQTPDIGDIMASSGFPAVLDSAAAEAPELLDAFIRREHDALRAAGTDYPEVEIREIWFSVMEELWNRGMLEPPPGGSSTDELALRHELSVNPVWTMPGFPEIVGTLKAGGLRIGIVSNAQFYTPLILEALAGKSLEDLGFEPPLCAWSYRLRRSKPSPRVFEGPLSQLAADGIPPSEILYVGNDMLNDVSAASLAGCRTALFAGDRRSLRLREGDERADAEPDMVVTELGQLARIIDESHE